MAMVIDLPRSSWRRVNEPRPEERRAQREPQTTIKTPDLWLPALALALAILGLELDLALSLPLGTVSLGLSLAGLGVWIKAFFNELEHMILMRRLGLFPA